MITKGKRLTVAIVMLLVSALLLGTASYAWLAMNTKARVDDVQVEAYSDSLFLQIKETSASDYETDGVVSISDGNQMLRLVTYGKIDGTSHPELVSLISLTGATGYAQAGIKYYAPADSDAVVPNLDDTTDPESVAAKADPKMRNFICISEDFTTTTKTQGLYKLSAITAASGTKVADTDYYQYDDVAETYTKVTVADGELVDGYFTLTATVEDSNAVYDGTSTYYELSLSGDVFSVKTGLVLGTPVDDYYTVNMQTNVTETTFADGVYYYIQSGDDYSYLGKVAGKEIANYIYWGRAYTSALNDTTGATASTLNIVGNATDLANYRYAKSFTFNQADGTVDAKNFRIEGISVTDSIPGKTNSIDAALNILFVVKSDVPGHDDKFILYDNGNASAFNGLLYDTLLGNEEETVTVDMYVYFDGTDTTAINDSVDGLAGKNIQIFFKIDNHDYNN